ncbi:ABC transporter ATP-binding protein [Lactobacillus acidophilus]|uniref:ABC transporter ATP-binding protein n=1 Tax=Lactobacillus amylovorus subsp. animalium TaxID=3378536 RepID=A0ABC9VMM4_LACAM|nr:ATP-binding cassette domain-containing protein [Lactobacillus acidophilus]AZN75677.1 ABC transporter ATP-binding protein [Lactobacillus acidophilus]
MLKMKHITLSFGEKKIFDDLSLNFEEGKIIGLVAPNGTGKSTLMNIILNNLTPQSGFIEYNSLRYKNEHDVVKLHKQICAFPDQSDLFSFMTGRDHLNLYADLWNNSSMSVNGIIKKLNMKDYVDHKVETYSLGMKQRLCFAMVVAANTPVMLLDEVMNGLDPQNVSLISEVLVDLKKKQKIIIMASHLLQNLQKYADRILFLKDGGVIQDFDNRKQDSQYLKVRASAEISKLLVNLKYEELPDGLILIPIFQNNADALVKVSTKLLQHHIQYSVCRISIGDLFNKIYGVN